jgi:hypothetical protein
LATVVDVARTSLLCENDFMSDLIFLKLGGSLITDKTVPFTPRMEKINEIASEIANARQTHPGLSWSLGMVRSPLGILRVGSTVRARE